MSKKSKDDLVKAIHPRYLQANKPEKGCILDEFVAATGCHRKHAIRRLRQGIPECRRERRGRKRTYTGDVVGHLARIWKICGHICGKRLQPFLPEMVAVLERHEELVIDAESKALLLQMSAATIDRLLARFRQQKRRGLSTTKPGTLLKDAIPVRTFADWDDAKPGFVEMDLVAHCGVSTHGQYLQTLTATDITTGWTECLALKHRSQQKVSAAIKLLRERLPFPLLGIDSDNDGVFINETLFRYCEDERVTFTRCRPYKKNDQAHVEQKNWSVVRKTIGYKRYESETALTLMESIYADLRLYVNFFQPVMKLVSKRRNGSKVQKRYDPARTPHQRVVDSPDVTSKDKLRLQVAYLALNPVQLRDRIDANLEKLWRQLR
jgi:Integrase core domain